MPPRKPAADPLLQLEVFRRTSSKEQAALLRYVDILLAAEGQSFMTASGVCQELILVISGELVRIGQPASVFGPGALLGARALADGRPPPFSVRAASPSRLGFLSASQVAGLLGSSPRFSALFATAVEREAARVPAEGAPGDLISLAPVAGA